MKPFSLYNIFMKKLNTSSIYFHTGKVQRCYSKKFLFLEYFLILVIKFILNYLHAQFISAALQYSATKTNYLKMRKQRFAVEKQILRQKNTDLQQKNRDLPQTNRDLPQKKCIAIFYFNFRHLTGILNYFSSLMYFKTRKFDLQDNFVKKLKDK